MAFRYRNGEVLRGQIKASYVYHTEAGQLYVWDFMHNADGIIHTIPLHTRERGIHERYIRNTIDKIGSAQSLPWPQKAEVTIASDGLAFEVLEIKLL